MPPTKTNQGHAVSYEGGVHAHRQRSVPVLQDRFGAVHQPQSAENAHVSALEGDDKKDTGAPLVPRT